MTTKIAGSVGSYTTSIVVPATPEAVFAAITDVRGWWSESIDGTTTQVGDVFDYRYGDVHTSTIRVEEAVPAERVVWRVLDNSFDFTTDQTEWKGTSIVFEITGDEAGSELRFTHVGLVPEYECFEICSNAWAGYIHGSLRNLIATGQGSPNRTASDRSYTTSFTVDRTPEEVYGAINDPRSWWDGEIDGPTDTLGGEFTYRYGDLHRSRQRVTELRPGARVAWLVLEGGPTFFEAREEWPGTTIVFEIARAGDQTEVRFTHVGLDPDLECFETCSGAWKHFVGDSLRAFIARH
jgi:uncharacterized protein YndB with AHSA1/START domain